MPRRVVSAFLGLLLAASAPLPAGAQDYGRRPSPFGVSPAVPYSGGTASYLPFGTNAGGFIPYSPGPGGGLGVVQPGRMAGPSAGPAGAMAGMPGLGTTALGRGRGALAPLAPIRALGPGGGMAGGSMIPRSASAGRMNRMARPPVGSYPFRQPPSLIAPASNSPAMSM